LRQGRRHMNVGGQADQAVEDTVRGDQDAVNISVFGDPFELGDAAYVFRVGADYVHRLLLDQVLEILP